MASSLPTLSPLLTHLLPFLPLGLSLNLILKKPTLDKELSNYRPMSNLSVISKIIENIVKSRFTEHLSTNNLLNPHQSAYCKHHSTEMALLYIHNYIINVIVINEKNLTVYNTSGGEQQQKSQH